MNTDLKAGSTRASRVGLRASRKPPARAPACAPTGRGARPVTREARVLPNRQFDMMSLSQIFADNRSDLPTQLGSAALRKVDLDVRQNSLFVSRMTNARAVQGVREGVNAVLAGIDNVAEARLKLKTLGQALGYNPEAGGFPGQEYNSTTAVAGSIRDLFSTERLNLILNTQHDICAGFAQQQHGSTPMALDAFPCWELVRVLAVTTPRGEKKTKAGVVEVPEEGWEARFQAAAEAAGDDAALKVLDETGRMIARKDSETWDNLSAGEGGFDDSLDNGGAPPFAFNSGKGWRAVPRAECIELGAIDDDEDDVHEADTDFGPNEIKIDGKSYDKDILQELSRSLRAGALAPAVKISVAMNAGDVEGHAFHGNQWTEAGGKMSGGDLRRRVRKETGMGNEEAKALLQDNKVPSGDYVVHKADVVERVRQSVEKIKSGEAKIPESKEPATIAHRLFKQSTDGQETYGLEKHASRQSIINGGYTKEAVASPKFEEDWKKGRSDMEAKGFGRYSNNWGQDIMTHTVSTSRVNEEALK